MYDFSHKHISFRELKKYYLKHKKEIGEIINNFTKDELCKICRQLNCCQWDENILGQFRDVMFANALLFAILDHIGGYEFLRYCNVIEDKRMSEDDFFKWAVKLCFDEVYRTSNPLC